MARGRDGSLLLSRMTLSFTTPRRFIPTLSSQEWLAPHAQAVPDFYDTVELSTDETHHIFCTRDLIEDLRDARLELQKPGIGAR